MFRLSVDIASLLSRSPCTFTSKSYLQLRQPQAEDHSGMNYRRLPNCAKGESTPKRTLPMTWPWRLRFPYSMAVIAKSQATEKQSCCNPLVVCSLYQLVFFSLPVQANQTFNPTITFNPFTRQVSIQASKDTSKRSKPTKFTFTPCVQPICHDPLPTNQPLARARLAHGPPEVRTGGAPSEGAGGFKGSFLPSV